MKTWETALFWLIPQDVRNALIIDAKPEEKP